MHEQKITSKHLSPKVRMSKQIKKCCFFFVDVRRSNKRVSRTCKHNYTNSMPSCTPLSLLQTININNWKTLVTKLTFFVITLFFHFCLYLQTFERFFQTSFPAYFLPLYLNLSTNFKYNLKTLVTKLRVALMLQSLPFVWNFKQIKEWIYSILHSSEDDPNYVKLNKFILLSA